jgi:hypothetical protein
MKKIVLFVTVALLFTGMAFANHGDKGKGKKCAKGKACCKKEGKSCGKGKEKKETTATVEQGKQ